MLATVEKNSIFFCYSFIKKFITLTEKRGYVPRDYGAPNPNVVYLFPKIGFYSKTKAVWNFFQRGNTGT